MAKRYVGTQQKLVNLDMMRKAGGATVTQPNNAGVEILKLAGEYAASSAKKAEDLENEFPEGINIPKVPSGIREKLVEALSIKKQEYSKAAARAALFPSWTKKHKDAVATMNNIKDIYANWDSGLTILQTNKDTAWKNDPGKGATQFETTRHNDLKNGNIDTEYNIQFTDGGVFFDDIVGFNDDGSPIVESKPISQFGPAPANDITGATAYDQLSTNVKNLKKSKSTWSESDMLNKVDLFLEGMNDSQLKNFLFRNTDGLGYNMVSNMTSQYLDGDGNQQNMQLVEITDGMSDDELEMATLMNEEFKTKIDQLKYSKNLKGENLRNEIYDSLKELYDNERVTSGGGGGKWSKYKLNNFVSKNQWYEKWVPLIENLNSDAQDIPVFNAPGGSGIKKENGIWYMRDKNGKWTNVERDDISEMYDIIAETKVAKFERPEEMDPPEDFEEDTDKDGVPDAIEMMNKGTLEGNEAN